MTYNIGIPASGNTPAHDQPLMMQNFNQIATSYNTDHVALNSGSNVGQHKKVSISAQGNQTLPSSAIALLDVLNGSGGNLNLYPLLEFTTTNGVTPLTFPLLANVTGSGTCAAPYTFKVCGLIGHFGIDTLPMGSPGTKNVVFTNNYTTNTSMTVVANPGGQNAAIQVTNLSKTGCTLGIQNSGGTSNVFFLAIGY